MQAFVQPQIARSTDRMAKRSQRPGLRDQNSSQVTPADESIIMPGPIYTGRQKPVFVHSPFQTALLFTAQKQPTKRGYYAYVCYLDGQQVLDIERLHSLRGHNPPINLASVLSRIRRTPEITGVILTTWHDSTGEDVYAKEFVDEVERQYELLLEADIKLVDNLRLSDTGVYSYYGQHMGPYSDAPIYHEQGISRLY